MRVTRGSFGCARGDVRIEWTDRSNLLHASLWILSSRVFCEPAHPPAVRAKVQLASLFNGPYSPLGLKFGRRQEVPDE
jgi:hypothetical protein